jgi:hypothetical protein
MFRKLFVHPQEVLHKRHLVYCMRIMSVGCATIAVQFILIYYDARSAKHYILISKCLSSKGTDYRQEIYCQHLFWGLNTLNQNMTLFCHNAKSGMSKDLGSRIL